MKNSFITHNIIGFFAATVLFLSSITLSAGLLWRETTIPAPPGVNNFGRKVALFGKTLALSDDSHAYIYTHGLSGWKQAAVIPFQEESSLGRPVAVTRAGVFVANSLANGGAGCVDFYRELDGLWKFAQRITLANLAEYDSFGYSLAANDDTLVVGAIGIDSADAANMGSAFVFHPKLDGTWVLKETLTRGSSAASKAFGFNVAILDDHISVSEIPPGGGAGEVYLFRKSNTGTWQRLGSFNGPGGGPGTMFGSALSIAKDPSLTEPYTFAMTSMPAVSVAYASYSAEALSANAVPGLALALDGATPGSISASSDMVAVGAASFNRPGEVFVLKLSSGSFINLGVVRPASPEMHPNFGYAVALDGMRLLVGSPSANSIHLYDLTITEDKSDEIKHQIVLMEDLLGKIDLQALQIEKTVQDSTLQIIDKINNNWSQVQNSVGGIDLQVKDISQIVALTAREITLREVEGNLAKRLESSLQSIKATHAAIALLQESCLQQTAATEKSFHGLSRQINDEAVAAENFHNELLRAQIERHLADGAIRVTLFYLPAALGGELDLVRAIVLDSIAKNSILGVDVSSAKLDFAQAEDASKLKDYKKAFDLYASSYRAMAGIIGKR